MSKSPAEIRLELLQLTYSHGREAREAVTRAEELEKYVMGEAGKSDTKPNAVPGQIRGNSNKSR